MNENTKNKFAEILQAAQNKANGQKATVTPEPINQAPTLEPVKRPYLSNTELSKMNDNFIKSVVPELSDMTFADLLSNDTNEIKESIAPEANKPNLRLIDYSDKAFAVVGDTKPIKDTLRLLGGSFNSRLNCGAGWIFSKKRLDAVKNELQISF